VARAGIDLACDSGMESMKWPELPYDAWRDSRETLHRWLQIVGKVRLSKSPWLNHSWQSTFYLTSRGLTTGLIHDGDARTFSIELDFIAHALRVLVTDGRRIELPLKAESVVEFYARFSRALAFLGIKMEIDPKPNELPDLTLLTQDDRHRSYDPVYARRFWRVMLSAHESMQLFSSLFSGKKSPIHFFWGGFDLAVTRFSGRRAPEHPGGIPHLPDLVTREAYSHEVSSCGFWPGDERFPHAAFYSYAYPEPPGFKTAAIEPSEAYYHDTLREFLLPYDAVRGAKSPENALMAFFRTTFDAAASLGKWDKETIEESEYLLLLQSRHHKEAA
jgi:hypothetical protein